MMKLLLFPKLISKCFAVNPIGIYSQLKHASRTNLWGGRQPRPHPEGQTTSENTFNLNICTFISCFFFKERTIDQSYHLAELFHIETPRHHGVASLTLCSDLHLFKIYYMHSCVYTFKCKNKASMRSPFIPTISLMYLLGHHYSNK